MLELFEFNSKQIRFVDGFPVANDVAETLGYAQPRDAVYRIVDKEYLTVCSLPTVEGSVTKQREVSVISQEAGIYQLIFKSKLPSAKDFQKWVFEQVLPSIRQTGSYSVVKTPQTYLEALKALVATEEEKQVLLLENQQLQQENFQLAEAVDELFSYSSIVRIAKFNGVSEKHFSWRRLKAVSQQMGIEIKKVPCPRFEYKLLYSHDVWRVAYPHYRLPETTTLRLAS